MNKAIRTAAVLGITVLSSIGSFMQGQQRSDVTRQPDKQLQDCRQTLNPDIFPSETCSVLLSYLSSGDRLGPVTDDGSFLVWGFPTPDGITTPRTYNLPPKLRSEIALNTLAQTIKDAQYRNPTALHGLFAETAVEGVNLWPKVRDVYCYYHPKETYLRFSGEQEKCPVELTVPDEEVLQECFEDPFTLRLNYHTFLNTLQAEEMDNRHSQK